MAYYVDLLRQTKESFGPILKQRGLVVAGEKDGNGLNLVFKSKFKEGWMLPIWLCVSAQDETGKSRAEWRDVEMLVDRNRQIDFPSVGLMGFVPNGLDQECVGRDEEPDAMLAAIAHHLATQPLMPLEVESEAGITVSDIVAIAHAWAGDQHGIPSTSMTYDEVDNVEILEINGLSCGPIELRCIDREVAVEILVSGALAQRLEYPPDWAIVEALEDAYAAAVHGSGSSLAERAFS